MSVTGDCRDSCEYGELRDGGFCYMFVLPPERTPCAQFRRRGYRRSMDRPTDRAAAIGAIRREPPPLTGPIHLTTFDARGEPVERHAIYPVESDTWDGSLVDDDVPPGAVRRECYETETEIIVCGQPKSNDERHNCDAMGCSTLNHVLYRFPKLPKTPPPTVEDILRAYLIKHGYDGLCRDGCGCSLEDFLPGDCPGTDCVPGYRHPCNCGQDCEITNGVHIGAEKVEDKP